MQDTKHFLVFERKSQQQGREGTPAWVTFPRALQKAAVGDVFFEGKPDSPRLYGMAFKHGEP